MQYPVNKGVGKSVELKGLRAQYVIYAVIGVVLSFVLFFIVSFIAGQVVALVVGALAMVASFVCVVWLNSKFGENGLTRLFARRSTPHRIGVNRRVSSLLQNTSNSAH